MYYIYTLFAFATMASAFTPQPNLCYKQPKTCLLGYRFCVDNSGNCEPPITKQVGDQTIQYCDVCNYPNAHCDFFGSHGCSCVNGKEQCPG